MASKKHDLMLNFLANPQLSIGDFQKAGLSSENTSLEDESTYLNSDMIKSNDYFKDEYGNFDKDKFHQTYLKVAQGMNSMNTNPQNFEAVYSKYNIWAPTDQRDQSAGFKLTKVTNPDRLTKSMVVIGQNGPREYTPQEIAQSQKVWNSEKNEWMDTPEDMFSFNKLFKDFTGFFTDNFDSTKVMAQYDEDIDVNGKKRGEFGFDENQIEHYKGDYMLNENGTYYYRTLKDGENIYGKQVLHYSDILTREGSALNAVDFLDSDDIQKSPLGSFIKDASLVGAMFLPYVGTAIAGATIFQQAMGLGATLGKIALGNDNSTMNWIEGLVEATNPMNTRSEWSSIDYGNTGRNTTWTIENLLGMTAEVIGQLKQQRLLFEYSPAIFKGKWGIGEKNQKLLEEKYLKELNAITKETKLAELDPKDVFRYADAQQKLMGVNASKAATMVENYMKNYQKTGEVLSKAYMTMLTVNDIYGEAKEAGAEDFDAAVITMGYAAMEYALLSTDIGKWILPELRGERLQNKAMVRALTKDVRESFARLRKAVGDSDEAKRTYLQKLIDFGKSVAKGEFNVGLGKRAAIQEGDGLLKAGLGSVFAGATAEAVEETTEEVLGDIARVLFNGLEQLQGKETRLQPFENVIDRYGMSFLGGFMGGGVSSAAFDFRNARITAKMDYQTAVQQLVHKAHNNDLDGIINIIKKEEIGNKDLSATKFDKDENGNIIWKQGDENDNQDLAIKNLLLRQIDNIKNTLDAHGGKTDDEFIDAQTLKDLRFRALRNTTTAGLFIQKYNETLTDLINKTLELKRLDTPEVRAENGDHDQKDQKSEELQQQRSQLEAEIKELDKKIEEFNSGAKAPLFMATALIESTPYIAKALMPSTFKIFAELKANRPFENISENELKKFEIDYQEYLKSDKKDDLQLATKSYLVMSNIIAQNLQAAQKIIEDQAANPEIMKLLQDVSGTLFSLDFEQDSDKWQESFGKWAADNNFKAGGMDVASMINILYNQYQENLKNNNDIVEEAKQKRDIKKQELEANRQIGLNELQDKFNLGPLGGGIDEATYRTSVEQFNKNFDAQLEEDLKPFNDDIYKLEEEKIKADEASKQSLNEQLQKTIFDISLKQANTLADKILSLGFVNGAIKNQVIDKLNSMSRTLEESQKKAEDLFFKELEQKGGDIVSFKDFINQGEIEFAKEITDEQTVNDYLNIIQQYSQAKQELDSKIKQIQDLGYTPIMDNVDAFALGIGKQKVSKLFDILGKTMSTSRQNVQTFTMTDDLYKQLAEAERVLDLYLATLEGARIDTVDPFRIGITPTGEAEDRSNVWGINKVLNEVHAKSPKPENDTWQDLPEIEGKAADMMIEDVKRLRRMLKAWKTLHSINQGQKLNVQSRVAAKTTYLLYDRIKRLLTNTNFPDKEKLVGELEELKFLKEETTKNKEDWNLSLNKDQQKQLEKERIQMEDAIFDYFQDKLDNIEELKKIFNPQNFVMYNDTATLLSEGSEDIDDTSLIGYLAAKASIKSSSFYKQYKGILKDGNIAPLIGQEISVSLGLANILNGTSISNIIKAYKSSLLEMNKDQRREFLEKAGYPNASIEAYSTDEGFKLFINDDLVPQYENITFIDGIPGAGKSAAVGALIYKYLKRYKPELLDKVWATHGGDNNSTNQSFSKGFAENIGMEVSDENVFDKEHLMKRIFDDYESPNNDGGEIKHKNSDYIIDNNGQLQPTWKVKNDAELPKIIFIDEVQQFSQIELLALDKVAREKGISIITSGDLNQSQLSCGIDFSSIINSINEKLKENDKPQLPSTILKVKLTRNQILHTPKLGTSMRTANNQKNNNMAATQTIMALGEGNLELHYYEDENTLAGDKRIDKTDQNQLFAYLDKIIPMLKDGEKIYYAHPVNDTLLWDQIKKQEKYRKHIQEIPGTALGQEGRFWIVELNNANSSEYMQDFYTGQTRSQQFSLILSPDQANNGKIKIFNVQDQETHQETYSKSAILKYATEKVAILEEIIPSDTEDIPYNPRNEQSKEPIRRDSGTTPISSTDSPRQRERKSEQLKEKRKKFLDSVEGTLEFEAPSLNPMDQFAKDLVDNHLETFNVKGVISGNPYPPCNLIAIGMPMDWRQMVLVDIDGVKVPFYCSTGKGQKKNVPIGKWYPVLGVFAENSQKFWLCKGSEDDINNFYGIPLLQAIAEQLNQKYGDTTQSPIDPTNGQDIPLVDPLDVIDILNQDLLPFKNHTADVRENLQKAIDNLHQKLDNKFNYNEPIDIDPFNEENSNKPEEINEGLEELSTEELEEKLDDDNGVGEKDEGERPTDTSLSIKDFKYKLFGNASFEVGSNDIQNGKIRKSSISYRIDGINGALNPAFTAKEWLQLQQEAAVNGGYVSLDLLEKKLGELRRMLLSIKDKSDLTSKVMRNLGLSGTGYIRYAVKTTSFDTNFINSQYKKLEKSENEPTPYARAQEDDSSRANKVNNRVLVAIIGTEERRDMLEIPLLHFNNPITLIRKIGKDNPNSQIFTDFNIVYNNTSGSTGEKQIAALQYIIANYDTPGYKGIWNLIRQYLATYRHILFVDDINWTPAQNLHNLGIQLNMRRGMSNYDARDYIETIQWTSLDDLRKDPCFTKISAPMQLKSGQGVIVNEDGTQTVPVANPKHPFVLVTDQQFNHSGIAITTDQQLIDEFIYQQFHDVPKTVQLVYVLPPKYSLKNYMRSLISFIIGETKESPLGNQRTAYKILESLFIASQDNPQELKNIFINALGQENGEKLYNKTLQTIGRIASMQTSDGEPDIAKQIKELTGTSEAWVEGIPKNIPLYRQLQNVLKQLVRPQVVRIEQDENGMRIYNDQYGSDKDFDRLFPAIQTLFDKSQTELYYQVKGERDSNKHYGQFVPLQVDTNGHINDSRLSEKGFRVTGSIASSAFETNEAFNMLLDNMLRKVYTDDVGNGPFLRSIDNGSYINANYSGWGTSPKSPPKTSVKSVDSKIVTKLERELGKSVSDSIISQLNPTKENDNSPELLNTIATQINSNINSPVRALVVENNLVLCNDSRFRGQEFNLQQTGSPIFKVQLGDTQYNGAYFNGTLTLLEDVQPSENTTVPEDVEITEELVNNNLNRFKSLIDFITNNRGNLAISEEDWNEMVTMWDLSNPADIAEFLDMQWDNIKDSVDLSQFADILQESNNQTSCPVEIKFKFM